MRDEGKSVEEILQILKKRKLDGDAAKDLYDKQAKAKTQTEGIE